MATVYSGNSRLSAEAGGGGASSSSQQTLELEASLARAAYENRTAAAQRLLNSGADASAPDHLGLAPLHWAARQGHEGVARLLLEWRASPFAQSPDGATPLHMAAEVDASAVVRLLLEHRADPAAASRSRRSPLHLAAEQGSGQAAAVMLEVVGREEAATILSATDHRGDVPLLCAASRGHANVLQVLVGARAAVQCRDRRGEGPLQQAVRRGHADVADVLIRSGSNVHAPDRSGVVPLLVATECGDARTMEVLLRHGADAGARDSAGRTALHVSAERNHPEAASILLQFGADANSRGNEAQTALAVAASCGHLAVAGALLEGGANPWAVDEKGCTPLHTAAAHDHGEVASLLVANSARIDALDFEGKTAAVVAAAGGQNSALRSLLRHGAVLPPETVRTVPSLRSIVAEVRRLPLVSAREIRPKLARRVDARPIVPASPQAATIATSLTGQTHAIENHRGLLTDVFFPGADGCCEQTAAATVEDRSLMTPPPVVQDGTGETDMIPVGEVEPERCDAADCQRREGSAAASSQADEANPVGDAIEAPSPRKLFLQFGDGKLQLVYEEVCPLRRTCGSAKASSFSSLVAESASGALEALPSSGKLFLCISASKLHLAYGENDVERPTPPFISQDASAGECPVLVTGDTATDRSSGDTDDGLSPSSTGWDRISCERSGQEENRSCIHPAEPVDEKILELMRSRGDGNIAVAWRRYFDVDSNGESTFQEFCAALSNLGYDDDALELWHALEPHGSTRLGLRHFDAGSEKLMVEFGRWCTRSFGGPVETYSAINAVPGSALTRAELLAGLRDLGLFADSGLSESLKTEDKFLLLMYPLIDPWDRGVVMQESFVFLEQDLAKRRRLRRKFANARRSSAQSERAKPLNSASHLLNDLSKRSKQAVHAGRDVDRLLKPPPQELEALIQQPRGKQKRHHRPASMRSDSTPDLARDVTPAGLEVLADVVRTGNLPQSLSLPKLPVQRPVRSSTGSRNGDGDSSYVTSCRTSIAASSIAATRQGMRQLYKRRLADQLPAVISMPNRDRGTEGCLLAAITGVDHKRNQVDRVLNPQRCEDFLSQHCEKDLFEHYYRSGC